MCGIILFIFFFVYISYIEILGVDLNNVHLTDVSLPSVELHDKDYLLFA